MSSDTSALPPTKSAMELAAETKNPLRKLYYWTLYWSETPYALPALFIVSFAESSFFPIPPDILLMAMCFATPKRWMTYAFWCTLASVLGGIFGWYIGWGLWEGVGQPIVNLYHGQDVMDRVKELYDQYGFYGILTAAITPIPYKVFTIASGVFEFSLPQLIGASFIGRGFRFFLVAGLIRGFGPRIKPFLEKHFELTMLLMLVVGVLGVLAIKLIPH
ncbi:MAG: YqaA family protein [Chthoniobacterales bacterium]